MAGRKALLNTTSLSDTDTAWRLKSLLDIERYCAARSQFFARLLHQDLPESLGPREIKAKEAEKESKGHVGLWGCRGLPDLQAQEDRQALGAMMGRKVCRDKR